MGSLIYESLSTKRKKHKLKLKPKKSTKLRPCQKNLKSPSSGPHKKRPVTCKPSKTLFEQKDTKKPLNASTEEKLEMKPPRKRLSTKRWARLGKSKSKPRDISWQFKQLVNVQNSTRLTSNNSKKLLKSQKKKKINTPIAVNTLMKFGLKSENAKPNASKLEKHSSKKPFNWIKRLKLKTSNWKKLSFKNFRS